MLKIIYGNDIYVIQKRVESLRTEFLSDSTNALNFVKFDAREIDLQELFDELEIQSLDLSKKMIVLDHVQFLFKKNKSIDQVSEQKLVRFYSNQIEDILLVVIVRSEQIDTKNNLLTQIDKKDIIAVTDINTNDWNKMITRFFQKNNATISLSAATELAARVSHNTSLFFNEANKLLNYTSSINLEDVETLVSQPFDESNFALSNAIIKNEKAKALKIYRDYMTLNYEPIAFVSQLSSQFRIYSMVFILADEKFGAGEIASRLAINPYRVKLALELRSKISLSKVKQVLEQLYNLDFQIKSGQIDRFYAFEMFLINY